MRQVKIGMYRHYKGGTYRVHAVGKMKPSEVDVVLYQDADGAWWVREVEEFCGTVQVNGETVPRFQYVSGA